MRRIAVILLATAALAGCKKHSDAARTAEQDKPVREQPGALAGRQAPPDRMAPPERPERRRGAPGRFDQDGDGQLSEQERAAMESQREQRKADMMRKLDTDGDGQISDAERAALKAQRVERMVERMDSDGDGKVSQDELDAEPRRRPIDLAAADTDHDGLLSVDELTAAMPERGDRGGWRPDGPPAPDGDAPN